MTMTRQHFELIAEAVSTLHKSVTLTEAQQEGVAEHFARYLQDSNPSFNPSRFLKACGVEG